MCSPLSPKVAAGVSLAWRSFGLWGHGESPFLTRRVNVKCAFRSALSMRPRLGAHFAPCSARVDGRGFPLFIFTARRGWPAGSAREDGHERPCVFPLASPWLSHDPVRGCAMACAGADGVDLPGSLNVPGKGVTVRRGRSCGGTGRGVAWHGPRFTCGLRSVPKVAEGVQPGGHRTTGEKGDFPNAG